MTRVIAAALQLAGVALLVAASFLLSTLLGVVALGVSLLLTGVLMDRPVVDGGPAPVEGG